jgi:hypothetical protein
MNPVKFKEVINETAQRLEQPPQLVAMVLQCYFKDLRAALSGLAHPRVHVLNLGTFQLKPGIVEKKLLSKKERLEKLDGHTARDPFLEEELQQQVRSIERALSIIDTEKQRKQQFKQNRKLHEQDEPYRALEKEV